jgi:ribosomal protein S4
VNGKKVNIPSYLVRVGDQIQVKEKSMKLNRLSKQSGRLHEGVPECSK